LGLFSVRRIQALTRGILTRAHTKRTIAATVVIQKQWRALIARSRYALGLSSVRRIQAITRGVLTRAVVERKVAAAVVIQKHCRSLIARSRYALGLFSVRRIQALTRGVLTRAVVEWKVTAAVSIQTTWRQYGCSESFKRSRKAAVVIQAFCRGSSTRLQRVHALTEEMNAKRVASNGVLKPSLKKERKPLGDISSGSKTSHEQERKPLRDVPSEYSESHKKKRKILSDVSSGNTMFSPRKTRGGTILAVSKGHVNENAPVSKACPGNEVETPRKQGCENIPSSNAMVTSPDQSRCVEKMKVVELREELVAQHGIEMKALRKLRKAELAQLLIEQRSG
jgi:myosin heavy subunit